jgi:tRNA pseudouridine38-40 synthase
MSKNILLKLRYDGKNYHGWQIQKNAYTVQEAFQAALQKLVGKDFSIKGCSRTDTGVHANMYCISVKMPANFKIPCHRFFLTINKFLPRDIAVYDCSEVAKDFHARYSCKAKEYIYKIWNNPVRNPFWEGYALHYWRHLNIDAMRRAGENFIGTHDFTSFCTFDARQPSNLIRTVKTFEISGKTSELVIIRIGADGFLYNMVRIIVGTLLRVSESKIAEDSIKNIILAKDRGKAGPTVKASGLYLDRVYY